MTARERRSAAPDGGGRPILGTIPGPRRQVAGDPEGSGMELCLIRHTRPEAEPGLCIGRLDVECAAGWEAHADRLGKILAPPERLYTSPSRRCRVLAERLGATWRLAPRVDRRLTELDFGDWEGMPWSAIGPAAGDHPDDLLNLAPPNGETFGELLARVGDFVHGLGSAQGRVAIVTHSGPLRAALVHCLGLPPDSGARFSVGYGRLTRMSRADGAWRLEVLNA